MMSDVKPQLVGHVLEASLASAQADGWRDVLIIGSFGGPLGRAITVRHTWGAGLSRWGVAKALIRLAWRVVFRRRERR